MSLLSVSQKAKKLNNFPFTVSEDDNYPEVYFDVALTVPVTERLGKKIEHSFFDFMHSWDKHHVYCIQYICLHKVLEESNTVRIAVDFGYCKPKILKGLVKWLRKSNLPIASVHMHSEG